MFRDWKKPSFDKVNKCFENDWSLCKAIKLIKDNDDLNNGK